MIIRFFVKKSSIEQLRIDFDRWSHQLLMMRGHIIGNAIRQLEQEENQILYNIVLTRYSILENQWRIDKMKIWTQKKYLNLLNSRNETRILVNGLVEREIEFNHERRRVRLEEVQRIGQRIDRFYEPWDQFDFPWSSSKSKFNKKSKPLIIISDVDPYGEEDWSDE
jgi:hypothetical protein